MALTTTGPSPTGLPHCKSWCSWSMPRHKRRRTKSSDSNKQFTFRPWRPIDGPTIGSRMFHQRDDPKRRFWSSASRWDFLQSSSLFGFSESCQGAAWRHTKEIGFSRSPFPPCPASWTPKVNGFCQNSALESVFWKNSSDISRPNGAFQHLPAWGFQLADPVLWAQVARMRRWTPKINSGL